MGRSVEAERLDIAREAARRWREREPERRVKIEALESGQYTKADTRDRLAARMRRLGSWRQAAAGRHGPAEPADAAAAAEVAAAEIAAGALRPEDIRDDLVERMVGETRDFLSVEFLEMALDAASCVGRIATPWGWGTGILVAPGLVVTNHHVIRTADEARGATLEMDYEENRYGPAKSVQSFALEPGTFFCASQELDFAVVGVARASQGGAALDRFGYKPLIAQEGKIAVGEAVNIIQHPKGEMKQVVIRESRLVDLPDRPGMEPFFHYSGDTERGSSGAPVFNDQWEIVALHHMGVPKTNEAGELVDAQGRVIDSRSGADRVVWVANEGIRVSRLVSALSTLPLRSAAEDEIRRRTLALWATMGRPSVQEAVADIRSRDRSRERAAGAVEAAASQAGGTAAEGGGATVETGTVTGAGDGGGAVGGAAGGPAATAVRPAGPAGAVGLTIPLHVTLSLGSPVAETAGIRAQAVAAAAVPAGEGLLERLTPDPDDPGYERRPGYRRDFLGFDAPLPTLKDDRHGPLASFGPRGETELRYHHYSVLLNERRRLAYVAAVNVAADAPFSHDRGEDRWFYDPRLPKRLQAGNEYYRANPLDRGHLVRRDDAAWGMTREEARIGSEDTFHWTNCAPQHEIFNKSSEASARGLALWGNLENAVSRAAGRHGGRLSVFNGPVFADADRPYRQDFFVPSAYWKVVLVRADDGTPRALAFLLSQAEQIADLAREGFQAADLAAFVPAQVPVARIERITGLDFGPLRGWDPLAGGAEGQGAARHESAARGDGGRLLGAERDLAI
jgi:endonuclease G